MEVRSREEPLQRSHSRPLRVALVDDHPAITDALEAVLTAAGGFELCGVYASGETALRELPGRRADVLVVDLMLPDMNGLHLVSRVHADFPELRIVVFSMCREEVFAERVIQAGALAFVSKSDPTQRVLQAIRSAARGDVFLNPKTASLLVSKLCQSKRCPQPDPIDLLTNQEMVVFQLLGQSYSITQIARQLNISEKTAMAYRRRAKEKLGAKCINTLAQHAFQWVHAGPDVESMHGASGS